MGILQTLMSYLSAHPQPLRSPSSSLHLAQYAPIFLSSSEAAKDTQETWFVYEQLLLASLRSEDDHSARLCLQRLGDRFGADSPRVRALTGLFDEATATSRTALEDILKRYNAILRDDPTNTPIEKRRIALMESLGRPDEAIAALTKLLQHSPTDAEAWSHLATLYRAQGLYAQSTFCLEEVLLIHPNAYNIHARLGETAYIGAGNDEEALTEAVRYFCRSVELCEWYVRGWYGLRLVTDKILSTATNGKGSMDRKTVEGLNAKATGRLAEILRRASSGEKGWQGFDGGELEAVRELIAEERIAR
jgi:tetratricopeptide (TPR) repeat protein